MAGGINLIITMLLNFCKGWDEFKLLLFGLQYYLPSFYGSLSQLLKFLYM